MKGLLNRSLRKRHVYREETLMVTMGKDMRKDFMLLMIQYPDEQVEWKTENFDLFLKQV